MEIGNQSGGSGQPPQERTKKHITEAKSTWSACQSDREKGSPPETQLAPHGRTPQARRHHRVHETTASGSGLRRKFISVYRRSHPYHAACCIQLQTNPDLHAMPEDTDSGPVRYTHRIREAAFQIYHREYSHSSDPQSIPEHGNCSWRSIGIQTRRTAGV